MKINNRRIPITPLVVLALAVIIFLVLWGGNGFQAFRSTEPPIQVRSDMYYQSKYMAQEQSTFFADRKAMRHPVPGTLPRNGTL